VDNTLEEKVNKYCAALRIGFRHVKGIRDKDIQMLVSARKKMFTTLMKY